MLPLLGVVYYRIDVRQHPGSRAYHRAGGLLDALGREGQFRVMLVLVYDLCWRALLWPRR